MIKPLLSRLTIAQKFIVLIVVISTLSIAFATALFAMNEYHSTEQQLRERVSLLAQVIAENVTAAVAFDDRDAAGELINALNADETIHYARVTNITGSELVSYGEQSIAGLDMQSLHTNYVIVERGLFLDRQRVGTLFLAGDKRAFYEYIKLYLTVALLVLCGSILFSVALSFWLQRHLTDPIVHLSAVARKVKDQGNYSLRASVIEEDEIGELTKVFNDMLEQIESRDHMLEDEVFKRTIELEEANWKLEAQAFYDGLTGLPNRTLFEDRMKKAIAQNQRREGQVAVLFIDLDGFKLINDTLGHAAGDELLIKVAERLAEQCREMDTVARFGGDEFIMLLVLDGTETLATIAQRIVEQFNRPFLIDDRERKVTLSIGGAIYGQHGRDFDILKDYADQAMYEAKRKGKNGFEISQAGLTVS